MKRHAIARKDIKASKKKARRMCQQRTQEILTLSASSGSAQSQTILGFQSSNEVRHAEEFLVYRNSERGKDRIMICKICESEERTIIWAREEKVEEDEWLESKTKSFEVAMKEIKTDQGQRRSWFYSA